MSRYFLLDPATTATGPQTVPPTPQIPGKHIPGPQNPLMGSVAQVFVFSIAGNAGQALSATVQVLASTDGIVWVNYGDPVTLTGTGVAGNAASPCASTSWSGNAPFRWLGATCTAISGTNCAATLTMST